MDLSKHFLYPITRHKKGPIFNPTIFLFFFSHPQEHTNPSTFMGAKQWVRALLLLRLFGPSVFDGLRTTQKIYHTNHTNDHHHNSHHAIFLFVVVSQNNQGHTARKKVPPQLLRCTFLEF